MMLSDALDYKVAEQHVREYSAAVTAHRARLKGPDCEQARQEEILDRLEASDWHALALNARQKRFDSEPW